MVAPLVFDILASAVERDPVESIAGFQVHLIDLLHVRLRKPDERSPIEPFVHQPDSYLASSLHRECALEHGGSLFVHQLFIS